MRRLLGIVAALCVAAVAAPAQDAQKVLETYRRNFAIASLDVKIQILQDAAAAPAAKEFGSLYQQAIEFVLENVVLLPADPRFRQLAGIAAEQVAAIGYAPARTALWRLFQEDAETGTRIRAATALGAVGAGDTEVVDHLNRFLDSQNALFAAGKGADLQVVPAILRALGLLGDPSSFPSIFTAMVLGYSAETTQIARESLLAVKGDLREMLAGIVRSGKPAEKQLALQMAVENDRISDADKAALAEFALDVGLHTSASDTGSRASLRAMRILAARTLRDRSWQKASPLLIENLDMTIMEADRGLADKGALLEAIASLGTIGTHEAAVRLTQYLVLLNSYTEKGKGYDEQVVGAVIENLGLLADKVAFDDLMYTQYLNYNNAIKKAARAALEHLRW
ncbi:MAG: hypothetical protein NTU62_01195 [Spirochaetes bacterium]|nr:hypothetical protein [Spirochaetota bacterium]